MSVDCFLDTNVLLYAATGTELERVKREKAQALIARVLAA
jgi:predicted nucleic acid-binding protein